MSKPIFNLLVALPSEAQPLIRHFKLTQLADKPFRFYARDDISLIVSGMGSLLSATAVGYLGGSQDATATCWINVGTAGHHSRAIGELIVAGRVQDQRTQDWWYPGFCVDADADTAELVSVEQPMREFPQGDYCYDMEAAAFMLAVHRISGSDWACVIKVVSDNAASGLDVISREHVSQVMGATPAVLESQMAQMRQRVRSLVDQPATELPASLAAWRFSAAQHSALCRIQRRALALAPERAWPAVDLQSCRDSRSVISVLEADLATLAPRFNCD